MLAVRLRRPSIGSDIVIDTAAIDKIITDEMTAAKLPGAVVAITGPKGDYSQGYGGLSVNDHYRIASNSKMFVALSVLMQLDVGKLTLDDRLDKYVSGVPNGDKITIRHLLEHRSGVYNYTENWWLTVRMYLLPTMSITVDEILNLIRGGGSVFAPGTNYAYSNSNFVLLALIVERVTGRSIKDVIADDIIEPLGLTQTSWPTTSSMPEPHAKGFATWWFLTLDRSSFNPDLAWACGSLVSTVGDMTKFLGHVNAGSLLSTSTAKLRRTTFCPMPFNVKDRIHEIGYGLGLVNLGDGLPATSQYQGYFGHTGLLPGYTSFSYAEPVSGASFVVFTNLSPASGTVINSLFRMFGNTTRLLYPETLAARPWPPCGPKMLAGVPEKPIKTKRTWLQ